MNVGLMVAGFMAAVAPILIIAGWLGWANDHRNTYPIPLTIIAIIFLIVSETFL